MLKSTASHVGVKTLYNIIVTIGICISFENTNIDSFKSPNVQVICIPGGEVVTCPSYADDVN